MLCRPINCGLASIKQKRTVGLQTLGFHHSFRSGVARYSLLEQHVRVVLYEHISEKDDGNCDKKIDGSSIDSNGITASNKRQQQIRSNRQHLDI